MGTRFLLTALVTSGNSRMMRDMVRVDMWLQMGIIIMEISSEMKHMALE